MDIKGTDEHHAKKIPKNQVAQAKSRYSIENFDKLIVRTQTHESEIVHLTSKLDLIERQNKELKDTLQQCLQTLNSSNSIKKHQ